MKLLGSLLVAVGVLGVIYAVIYWPKYQFSFRSTAIHLPTTLHPGEVALICFASAIFIIGGVICFLHKRTTS